MASQYLTATPVADSIPFDNSTNGFDAEDVQAAIEETRNARVQYPQFQKIGNMNFDQYLFSGSDYGGINRESGNASNGYEFQNSAPLAVEFDGTVVSAAASIKGLAGSTGSPAATVTVRFELWKVGFQSEGTKLGDITFDVDSSQFTIGNFFNSSIDTDFAGRQAQDVDVTAGDLLALKFIRTSGAAEIVASFNTTVVLEIRGSL